jgi:hypothetical protein
MAKAVASKKIAAFGKKKTGKAVKHPNKHSSVKKYNSQGR